MNLRNLTHPTAALVMLRDAALAHAEALPGLKEHTEVEALPAGYLHIAWRRARGVEAHIDVHVGCSTVMHQAATRHNKDAWARVSAVDVTVGVTQMTSTPSVAVAQASLHQAVACIACLLEAMLAEMTVGVPCDENGRELVDPKEATGASS